MAPSATEQLAAERRGLAATLRAVGPEAPTLAGAWKAGDLAAHVVATEKLRGMPTFLGRRLVLRGIRLNDTFAGAMAIDVRRFRRRGFDWALARLERQGPWLLDRPSVLPVSVFEIFVHHEDVRRPNAVAREETPDVVPSIEWLLRYHRKPLGETGVRVELPGGRELHGGGPERRLTLRGAPGEVLLWLAGRREVAEVEVDGEAAALERTLSV